MFCSHIKLEMWGLSVTSTHTLRLHFNTFYAYLKTSYLIYSDRVTIGRSLDLPVYFGDAGSREVRIKREKDTRDTVTDYTSI